VKGEIKVGFIGGGRITRIILGGLKNAKKMVDYKCVVSDIQPDTLEKLKRDYPEIDITDDNRKSAESSIVFFAVHPPVIGKCTDEIKGFLKKEAVIISLAPKITIAKLSEMLGSFNRIVRMIPNAPSIINSGYNPVSFSNAFTVSEKQQLLNFLNILGESPEVEEEKLEAYAILTAMGPTYIWFQLYELHNIVNKFGLDDTEIEEGITKMIYGAVKTMYNSGLTPSSVMDLVPVKPLGEDEESIKNIYRTRLENLFKKLKG